MIPNIHDDARFIQKNPGFNVATVIVLSMKQCLARALAVLGREYVITVVNSVIADHDKYVKDNPEKEDATIKDWLNFIKNS